MLTKFSFKQADVGISTHDAASIPKACADVLIQGFSESPMADASKKPNADAMADTEALHKRNSEKDVSKVSEERPKLQRRKKKDEHVSDVCGLASIVFAIDQSRTHYENIKKMISFALTAKVPQMMAYFFYITLKIPEPLDFHLFIILDIFVFLLPAFALIYEKAEGNLLSSRPRDMINVRLTGLQMFLTSFINGLWHTAAGTGYYFLTMSSQGFFSRRLFGLANEWHSVHCNYLVDSYGTEWSFEERQLALHLSHTSYFFAIVVNQWTTAFCCKARKCSVFEQGLFGNAFLLVSLALTGILTIVLVCFVPYFISGYGWGLLPTYGYWNFLFPVPIAIAAFANDELRRLMIRKIPDGWLEEETCI